MFLALFFLVASTQAALTAYYPLDNGAFVDRGAWSLPAGQPVQIRLFFSSPIDSSHLLSFSVSDSLCSLERHSSVTLDPVSNGTVLAIVTLPSADGGPQYFCLDGVHQGTAPWLTVHTFVPTSDAPLIPFALEIVLIVVLLALSGLFSGLNLGLMSLDTTELKIVLSVGSPTEQSYARAIMPLRERGNMLLCTVLLGNVIVNSTLTIFLESVLGSGIFAVLGSAFGIVVVGEIFPQALCSRHALWVGAHTIWLMKFFMLLTSPVSYPISVLLDRILGEELGAVYQRKQLLKLVQLTQEHSGLGQNEIDIITGALTYRDKTVGEIMTPLEAVFMLELGAVLDITTITRITQAGHSRIPVYQGERDKVIGLLFVRDLAFVDPEDSTPLEAVIRHYKHSLEEVYDDTKLDTMLDFFRKGKTHMCFVVHVDSSGDKDPRLVVVGVVTLEDVLEEIIQTEIYDEKDQAADATPQRPLPPFAVLGAEVTGPCLSDNFADAVTAFLARTPVFAPEVMLPAVLRRLIRRKGVLREVQVGTCAPEDLQLYRQGTATAVFSMVLEGRVGVVVGADNFKFEAGPFTPLAMAALQSKHFVADFDATLVGERVLMLSITRAQYQHATEVSRRKAVSGSGLLDVKRVTVPLSTRSSSLSAAASDCTPPGHTSIAMAALGAGASEAADADAAARVAVTVLDDPASSHTDLDLQDWDDESEGAALL